MSTLVATVGIQETPLPSAGVPAFAAIKLTITDNSGAPATFLNPDGTTGTFALLNGSETPTPWTATGTGVDGTSEASFTAQAIDSNGNPLGTPFTFNESGTGGVTPGNFAQPVAAGSSLTVTG
jgi:hypothetical protein